MKNKLTSKLSIGIGFFSVIIMAVVSFQFNTSVFDLSNGGKLALENLAALNVANAEDPTQINCNQFYNEDCVIVNTTTFKGRRY